jgi:hypothetical protein
MTTGRLVLIAALVVALVAGVGRASAATPTTTTIARASAFDFRVAVSATKGSGGGAPSATAYVTASTRTGRAWTSLGRVRVGRPDGFFWKVVTGPRAIRELSIDTRSPERVGLQLLLSPALGWSPVYHFHVEGGRLVAGQTR